MRIPAFLALLLGLCVSAQGQQYTFKHSSLPCLDKTFTIVVHVFPDSLNKQYNIVEANVRQAVASVNPFFAPICARFEVCEFRYHDNWQYDTLRSTAEQMSEITTKYNVERRINMYLVDSFENPYARCGLATLNGINDPVSSFVLVRKNCLDARTIAHELGHFFNLKHTFEGNGAELVDGSNCTTEGDGICDTPADPYVPGEPFSLYLGAQCRFISGKRDAKGDYYNPDVGNIMSYYPCDTCGFTWGQLNAMAEAYLSSAIKFW